MDTLPARKRVVWGRFQTARVLRPLRSGTTGRGFFYAVYPLLDYGNDSYIIHTQRTLPKE